MGEFEPREMMEFVRDMAVCAWVGVDDAAVAVRLSAQVNGYRHYVSVCRTSGIDEGFRAEDLLGFLKALSVSWGSDEWEGECLGGEVGQIYAYRQFVCVRPDWMLPQSVEVEEGFVGEEYGGIVRKLCCLVHCCFVVIQVLILINSVVAVLIDVYKLKIIVEILK